MELVIVPNELRDAINVKLDVAIAAHPGAAADRDELYSQLISFFHEHGYIPDFDLAKREL